MSDANVSGTTRRIGSAPEASATPLDVVRSFTGHTDLIWQMTRRMVAGRYRGSVIGMSWSLFYPILMLMVYTFVFGVVFKMRGMSSGGSTANFAMSLFAGLICHQYLAECLSRAPGLVVGNAQYVKKVVFPLEVLPWISVGAALFQTTMSFIILVLFNLLLTGDIHWTAIFAPLVLAPLGLLCAGLIWFVAGLCVYIRDIQHVIGVLTTMLLFLSPVFYSVEILPGWAQKLIYLNPLTFIIEQFRKIILFGELPNWGGLLLYAAAAYVVAWLGLRWFQKIRSGFADVL